MLCLELGFVGVMRVYVSIEWGDVGENIVYSYGVS